MKRILSIAVFAVISAMLITIYVSGKAPTKTIKAENTSPVVTTVQNN
jgi:hypothetical protein